VTDKPPPPPPDPKLPELAALLGDDAEALLEAAIEAPVRGARATQVRYDPGRAVTVTYSATIEGRENPLTVAAYAGRDLPSNTAIVGDGTSRIAIWRFPDDPRLPGLPHAVRPELLAGLLAEVGVKDPIWRVHTRSYRARRRAVVEVVTERHRLFLKVARPSRVAALQATHTDVAGQVRVPRSLGYSPEFGIAVLEAIPGSTLRHSLGSGDATLPSAAELVDLLNRLPVLPTERPGLIERAPTHQRFLSTILPGESERLAGLVKAIGQAPSETLVAAHNDLHAAQVIVSNGRISGLVDIDTVGLGHRADDFAMLLGHLHTLAVAGPSAGAFAGYGARLLPEFAREVGKSSLRLRTAAAVMAFATAPFRIQQPDWPSATSARLAAAQQWIDDVG
jgi:hypothetical protein